MMPSLTTRAASFVPALPFAPLVSRAHPISQRCVRATFSQPAGPKLDRAELAQKQYIFLGSQRVGDAGARVVAAALATPGCPAMGVNMDSCGISDDGAEALAEALRGNSSLQELILLDNEIGDRGAVALAAALQAPGSVVRVLSLARNRIREEGGRALGSMIGKNIALQSVYMMGMDRKAGDGIGDGGAEAWAEGIARNKGTFWFANLDGNKISPNGLEKIKLARVEGKHTIYPADKYPRRTSKY